MYAAPGELDAERDQPQGEHHSKSALRRDGGEIGSGETAEQTADYQFRKDRAVVVSGGNLKTAADERKAESEKQVRAHDAGRRQFRQPKQHQGSQGAGAGGRESHFGADRQRD